MFEPSLAQKVTLEINKDGTYITTYSLILFRLKVTDLLGRSLESQQKATHLI